MAFQRIAFVDHSYHRKTRSTFFIRDALFPGMTVEDWWDETWNGGPAVDIERLLSQDYDMIAVCQVELVAEALARHNRRDVVFIPMWDGCKNLPVEWWQALDGFRIVSFCRALHEQVRRCRLPSMHVEYYPDPSGFPRSADFSTLRGFFWQRHRDLSWRTVLGLVGDAPFAQMHFHLAQDPGTIAYEPPTPAEQRRHGLTVSHWFERQGDYLDVLARSNVYFAPRPSEGIGFSFLEAMAMGMCVVAPNAPTMNEYITDGATGLLWNLAEPRPLDFSHAAELGRRARDKAEVGHQKWLSELPVLQDFVTAPTRQLPFYCDSSRFHGGPIAAIARYAAARNAFPPISDRSMGGLRTRGVVRCDADEMPLVTVAMVTFNCIDRFEGTIRNILRQDYPNLEIIVVDGDSTDGTRDLIQRYDDYVDLWTSETDSGPFDAMNKAADLAAGRYILFMNAGDWFFGDDAISRAMRNASPDADFIIGHHIYRQTDGTEVLHKAADFAATWHCIVSGELSDAWLGGIPCHQATLTRTWILRQDRYDTRLQMVSDHEFMYRQRRKGGHFHNCDSVISVYSGGGLTARNHLKCLREWLAVLSEYGSPEAAERYFGPARDAAVVGSRQAMVRHADPSIEPAAWRDEIDVLRTEVERLKAIEASTTWKITWAMRMALNRAPRVLLVLRRILNASR